MTRKADFDAEQWSTLVEAPLLAGLRVVTAARGGTIRESMALGRAYQQAREQHGESELLDQLVSSAPTLDAERARSYGGNVAAASTERLRTAVGLLEGKATADEVEAYRQFVLRVARTVAEAHKEGGVLGVGGQRISEEEQRALDEIAAALGAGP